MIDWPHVETKDFKIEIEIESVTQNATHVIYPVNVIYTHTGETAFKTHVPFKLDFHKALKAQANWKSVLINILNTRVKSKLVEKINAQPPEIADLVELSEEKSKPIK